MTNIVTGSLIVLLVWLLAVPAGFAQGDYPAPLYIPSIQYTAPPTATPTPIPTPLPTREPCLRAQPRNVHAERIVLRPNDFPSSYGMVLDEVVDFGPFEDVIHSDVATVLDSTRFFVGPAAVGSRATVFCVEQGAFDAWPVVVRFIDQTMSGDGEIQHIDIPVGDQRYAIRAISGPYVGYGAAFRKENVIGVAIIAGFDGILTYDQVYESLRTMRNKSD